MKIIHCADIHADSKMGTHFTSEQAKQRRLEIVETFERMVSYADRNDVKVIIIAGDLFDTKSNRQKSIKKRIADAIHRTPRVDFLYLRGNHDEDVNFALDENLPNLKRFTKEAWRKYSYGNIGIWGREFDKHIPKTVYDELIPVGEKMNIVVMHGQIREYAQKDGAAEISLPDLKNKDIDYIALGHIHSYRLEQLDQRAKWCYPGCLEGRGFDECGEKGFVLLTITDRTVKSEFVPFAKRQIHRIEVNIEEKKDYFQIMNAIRDEKTFVPSSDIVEIDLTGEVSENTDIEADSYQRALSSEHYYVRVKDTTKIKIDYGKYKHDISLKGEFIRLVESQTDINDSEKSKIIMTGIKALAGRTI